LTTLSAANKFAYRDYKRTLYTEMANNAPSLEAKLVILGAQSVGKTSLVHRYVKNSFIPPNKSQSTVGASFLTTRVHDPESGATIRLQIWDTAGQERFRSISKLYYRGADAAILCYDVSDRASFEEMGRWLAELREHTSGQGETEFPIVLHVVGTKTDLVAADPSKREVPFERCIGYVAEQLYPDVVAASGVGRLDGAAPNIVTFGSPPPPAQTAAGVEAKNALASPQSNRSSGFWGSEVIWDCCHEVSSKDGEGIDEVFRVITRKLVDQHARRMEALQEAQQRGRTPGPDGPAGAPGYFDLPGAGQGSFKLGHGDKRRSWLGFPSTPGGVTNYSWEDGDPEVEGPRGTRKGRCC
jgi:small GTP-binding protein